jgi:assimilatory nitrate reductase catalytic subunit
VTKIEIRTTCPYCGVGCGIIAKQTETGLEVRGDPDHPANFGRLCSKGLALGETVDLEGRLMTPMIDRKLASWDMALDLVADRFQQTIKLHGPDSVAFYVSGQMLTEDYYVANKLMKGFVGSANIDTNSRLCMASSVAGHRRAFGSDTVPGQYEDLELADLVVLVGSNLAWCHPVLYQRIAAAKALRPEMQVVVIDPRRTATCDLADMHLAVAPGSDAALFNALLAAIQDNGAVNQKFVAQHVSGFQLALDTAQKTDPSMTGLDSDLIDQFCKLWIRSEKVVTVYSQGINQSETGTDKVNAIINCHLATGRIGKPGMGPFSVTGQPNAMGGREVGGLANMLACHLDLDNAKHRLVVQDFWHSPTMPTKAGLKAVDMFKAVADGRIKAIWIIHTNPAVTMPDTNAIKAALATCPFVVVSDITASTDTAAFADVLLPATAWGEKDGTVTNSERTISRQRRVLPAPAQAKDDWCILAEVAKRMGWSSGFAWSGPAEIFREYAALSGKAADLGSDFDISDYTEISEQAYADLKPVTWPQSAARRGGRFFADGKFHTPDGRGRMLAIVPALPSARTPEHPFRLNTGRNRDQWHTMTRTGKSARLSQHLAEPYLEIHPLDAAELGLTPASLVQVTNQTGVALLRVLPSTKVARGQVFSPIHWNGENAPTGRIDALVPSLTDPISGQPASKSALVAVQPFPAKWYGFAASTQQLSPKAEYWAQAKTSLGWRYELAGINPAEDWLTYAANLFDLPDSMATTILDPSRNMARIAFYDQDNLVAIFFSGPAPVELSRNFVVGQLGKVSATSPLAGKPGSGAFDPGPIICACMGVGLNTLLQAIKSGQANSPLELTKCTGAGSSCGTCRSELAQLFTSSNAALAAK